ncbi:hypothetical protein [Halobacillus naozhouensis]|uniref:NETI protein n=1 Tax=Halobacillus naozhouensis TaxID=554880 RepID=A0ABY8IZF6_9BACI|nr:hypothetical protein [Halobacillus naozhouensis]WFT75628.1 hypothetical protein P9989_04350 [Halobacillus naozhouensis]
MKVNTLTLEKMKRIAAMLQKQGVNVELIKKPKPLDVFPKKQFTVMTDPKL